VNIALVSREYPPETLVGGIGTYTHHVARALAGRGHTVHVITETAAGAADSLEQGVVVHRLPRSRAPIRELRGRARAGAVARTVDAIRPLDVVQACEYAAEGLVVARQKRVPLITRLATPRFVIDEIEGRSSVRGKVFADRYEREQTLRSRAVISSTHALAQRVGQAWGIPAGGIDVIPNALNLAGLRQLAGGARREPPPAGSPYVIYFGRLEERKGVPVLAEAMRAILRERKDLHLVLAGAERSAGTVGGEVRARLSEAEGRVHLTGLLPPASLLPLVAGATLAVLPSLWEAFGFVVLEAMALGVPVVATSGSGFAEIVQDGVSGRLVPPGDAAALEMGVRALLGDETLRRRLGNGARHRAEQFDTGRVCERLEALYERVRNGSGR